VRHRGWPQLTPWRLNAVWPRAPVARATAVDGGCAPATSGLRRRAREVRREVRELVLWFVWAEGGRNQGNAVATRSLAMAASMAAPLWSVRARGGSDCGQHGVHINARRSKARIQGGRGASKAWLPRARPRVALCGNSTNTWRMVEWVKWSTDLGRLRTEFRDRPKTKFDLHLKLSNFG
jgi:hypothetical protein